MGRPQTKADSKWRKAVIAAEGGACFGCGRKAGPGVQITAHHVLAVSAHPEHRHNPANGMALCRECHDAMHGYLPNPSRRRWKNAIKARRKKARKAAG